MSNSVHARPIQSKFTRSRLTRGTFAAVALFICANLLSCGGSKSSISVPPIPGIAGPWEFIAVSNDNNYITGIEVALKESQVLVNGVAQPNGQISANSTQIAFVSLETVSQNLNATGFGGPCGSSALANSSLGPGTVTAPAATMTFSFTENGIVFNVTGTLSGDGQSFLNGTYTQSGTTCPDSGGTITGAVVPKLTGMYAGQVCQPSSSTCSNTPDTATATLSESSSGTLTLTLAFTGGPDAGANLTLTGPATGNAFSVSGTFQGQLVTYYGYYELVKNVTSVYLVNATSNTAQPTYAGTLPLYQQP
jgi:hypothetical protein